MVEEVLSAGGAWARREEKEDGERCGGGRQSRGGTHLGSRGGEAAERRWQGNGGGGGARARSGEEESGDGCCEGRVRTSAFYRGRREAEARGTQWPASMPGLEDTGYSE
jgi:hypothetical protein